MNNKKSIIKYILLIVGGQFLSFVSVMIMLVFPNGDIFALLVVAGQLITIAGIILLAKYLYKKAHDKATQNHQYPTEVTYQNISSTNIDSNYTAPTKFTYNTDTQFKSPNDETNISFVLCIILLFLFAPIGLGFLIKKVVVEKSKYYDNGIKLLVIAGFYVLLTIAVILIGLPDFMYYSVPFALFFIIFGSIIFANGKKNDKYMYTITKEKITNLDEIAKRTKSSYSTVTKKLNALIDNGMLYGAYIDHNDREIIVHGISKKVAYKCNSCGGTSVFYFNEDRICRYCGARI